MSRIESFFKGNSICDVGCGGGDLVYYISQNHSGFREFAGIDVMDWRTEAIRESINFQMLDLSQPGVASQTRYDTLSCIAVLHHVGHGDENIHTFLQNLRTALSPHGRLIIEEDVMLPSSEIEGNPLFREQAGKLGDKQQLFGKYLKLDTQAQKNVMILVDILANALTGGVTDMAFPFGFRTIDHWSRLFRENGYLLEETHISGFQPGLFNRSSHVYFILKQQPQAKRYYADTQE